MHDETRHFLEGKTIVVAGAGIAGSALVVGLRKLWDPALKPPTIVVYDRDPCDPALRRAAEGYSLSLSGHSEAGGLVALQRLGLVDRVFAHAVAGLGHGSGSFKLWGPDRRERPRVRRTPLRGLPTASIRITRSNLRRVLHDAVDDWDPSRIQWASQCVAVRRLDNGRLRVRIRRGGRPAGDKAGGWCREGPEEQEEQEERAEQAEQDEETDCDLLVAADGANSKLRALLRPDDRLQYAGAVLRGGLSRFDAALPTPPGRDWGFIMSDTGVSCFLSPVDDRTVMWPVGHLERHPAPELGRGPGAPIGAAIVARARQLGSPFREPFQTVAARTDPAAVMCINARDKAPFRHSDVAAMPVVFVGDSNHALSPLAGFRRQPGAGRRLGPGRAALPRAPVAGRGRGRLRRRQRAARQGHPRGLAQGPAHLAQHGRRRWLLWVVMLVRTWLAWLLGWLRHA